MGRAGAAAHEDPELGYRLHKGGLRNPAQSPLPWAITTMSVTPAAVLWRSYQRGLNFGEFRMLVPEPEIPVAYHVLNAGTLGDHFRAWFGPRRRHLAGGDRNPPPAR